MDYNYERDSLPEHIRRARDLQALIADMRSEMRYSADPVPHWYVDRFNARRAELKAVMAFRGVKDAFEERQDRGEAAH